jgi:hypothetical protein
MSIIQTIEFKTFVRFSSGIMKNHIEEIHDQCQWHRTQLCQTRTVVVSTK